MHFNISDGKVAEVITYVVITLIKLKMQNLLGKPTNKKKKEKKGKKKKEIDYVIKSSIVFMIIEMIYMNGDHGYSKSNVCFYIISSKI